MHSYVTKIINDVCCLFLANIGLFRYRSEPAKNKLAILNSTFALNKQICYVKKITGVSLRIQFINCLRLNISFPLQ